MESALSTCVGKKLSVRVERGRIASGSLSLVSLEHVLPERLDLLYVAAFTVYWHPCQEEPFRELAFQADFLDERAAFLMAVVVTQP